MTLIELLQAQWSVLSLQAPRFIWLVAAALLTWTLLQLLRLWWFVRQELLTSQAVKTQLETLGAEHDLQSRQGLSGIAYEAIGQVFARHRSLLPAWRSFDTQIIVRRDAHGHDLIWTAESAASAFNDTTIIDPRLNQSFFVAVPGIVTGTGLLCTFLAILVALLDVQLVGGQFQGLDHLVSGLSGKFLSSIVALGASTLFLFAERPLWHRLTLGIRELVTTVDHLVPCLPPTRLLADIHRDIEVQVATFQHFQADFSTRLQQGIREGLGPSLERISVTLQELSHLLRAAEARQQETITGTLDGLLAGHTAVLQELTAQMREVAGMSVTQIGSALTAVVYDLSTKVSELGQQMAQTATESAGQTASAAHAVIERADAWSARNAEQLAQLLERHRGQLEHSHDVQAAFDTTLVRFVEALAQYTTITGHLRQVANQVRTMVTAAASATETIRDATMSLDRAAGLAALQAERFAEAAQRQEEVQLQMVESMRQYQQVFSQVNTTASDLLTQMGQHLRHYTDTSRQGFASLIQAVDEHFANASRRLGETVHGLEAHLQDLSESLERWRGDRSKDGD
jgi:hypothetical protein